MRRCGAASPRSQRSSSTRTSSSRRARTRTPRIRRRIGRDYARSFGLDAIEDAFEPLAPVSLEARLAAPAASERVSFLLLGWCAVQSVRPALEAEARERGLEASVAVGFPGDCHLADEVAADVIVVQLSHRVILAPVFDCFYRLAPEEAAARVDAACAAIERAVAAAGERAAARGALLLVQGIASPQTSPLGAATEARRPPGLGFFDAVARLNAAARAAVAARRDALFVDEDALLAAHGKRRLMDDLVSTYSHHGALAAVPSPEGEAAPEEALGAAFHAIFARAYLDLYEAWRGRRAIRCVAVDLDGTLWPGEIGDDAFSFDDPGLTVPLMYGRFGGLQQALRILRGRGILLAVVSKNDRATVLAKWRKERVPLGLGVAPEETEHYLGPEDFVALKIGWERKSEQIRALAGELGVALAEIAFIDDHPVEREEVRRALPEVLVLGDDMRRVREVLLSSPRFQVLEASAEARARSETTRARLLREEAARATGGDHRAFLASLGVRCRVRRERDGARAARISELLRRTNQFNTTGERLGAAEVEARIARPGAAVLSMEVADRFAAYGLVGVALVEAGEVTCFALSCRVIGLEVERPLLRRALLAAAGDERRRVRVLFRKTDRNLPASRLFLAEGFEPLADGGGYIFDLARREAPADPEHCTVEEEEESPSPEPSAPLGGGSPPG
jgi:FkbH-like protein